MSPSGLLRASAFCRERTPRKLPVTLKLLKSCRPLRHANEQRIIDQEATVYVPVDLLVALSLKVGELAWLGRTHSLPGILVIVLVEDDATGEETCNGRFVVRVPPTVAASVGVTVVNDTDSYVIQSYHEEVPEAVEVKVRPIGRPVPVSWKNYPRLCPDIDKRSRLLGQSILISFLDAQGIHVFEVVDLESSSKQHLPAALATTRTKWTIEQPQRELSAIRRLPPLRLAASFHVSVQPKEKLCSRSVPDVDNRQNESPPHPSVADMKTALLLPASSPPAHRILHVMGTEANHTGVCIQSAADYLGLRYICIRGLSAHAHASGISVSTGSLVDQLAGCRAAIRHAQECVPCVLHLCNVDHEWSKEDEPMRHMQQQRLWTVLEDALANQEECIPRDESLAFTPSIIVVLSTAEPLSAGPLLYNLVFASTITQPPDKAYARYLWNDHLSFDMLYASFLEGRSARDVCHLQRYWKDCCSPHSDGERKLDIFCKEMDAKKQKSAPHIPTVEWNDVGGLAHVRREIMDAIELPLKHPNLFPRSGGRSGILLYGPPGTGKTLIAKAVATECGLPFLSVKGPELLGSYVGESEANVRATFAAARQAAKQGRTMAASVLFFDELDSLAPRRGGVGDNGGVMERVVAMLLTELDGSSSGSRDCMVFVIGATNRPDLLDPSILVPGRLDRLVYLGIPTKSVDRAQILSALIRKFRLDPVDPVSMAREVVDQLPPNLTGADFSAIASSALRKGLERVCEEAEDELQRRQTNDSALTLDKVLDEWEEDRLVPVVTRADLIEACKDVVPSVGAKQLEDYERLRVQYCSL